MADRNYLDNKTLYTELVKWRTARDDASEAGLEQPPIPRYVGECIFQIATKMATKYNFVNYTYNDEMVADALENACAAIYSFDVEKSQNPFGYLSITIYYAFLRRITKEKKQLIAKYKIAESMKPMVEAEMAGSQEEMPLQEILGNEYMMNLVENHEKSAVEKKLTNRTWKTKTSRIKDGTQK